MWTHYSKCLDGPISFCQIMLYISRLCFKNAVGCPKSINPSNPRCPVYTFGAKTKCPGCSKAKVSCQGRLSTPRAQPCICMLCCMDGISFPQEWFEIQCLVNLCYNVFAYRIVKGSMSMRHSLVTTVTNQLVPVVSGASLISKTK